MLWGCFSEAGTEGLREEKHHSENTVQSIQNFRLGRRFTFQQDNDPKHTTRVVIHNAVNVFEWTSHSLDLNPIKYFWRNLKTCVCPHPTWKSLRGEEVKRWGDKWQIIAKCWWTKRVTSNKQKTWGTSVKYLVRGMNTYAMYLFEFLFLTHLQSCYNSVFALSIWYMECRLMWGGGK